MVLTEDFRRHYEGHVHSWLNEAHFVLRFAKHTPIAETHIRSTLFDFNGKILTTHTEAHSRITLFEEASEASGQAVASGESGV
jgi:hypothetical protein